MLGTFLVFCLCLGAFLWYLQASYETNEDDVKDQTGAVKQQPQQGLGRKRNRRKHGGKKPEGKRQLVDPATTNTANGGAGASSRSESVRTREKREKRELEAKEWPELGATPEKQETMEDLAALHASLLRNATSSMATVAEESENTNRGRRYSSNRVAVGDKVDARFKGGTESFPAMVTKTLYGGLVNLVYDDGEVETRVPLSLVRLRGGEHDSSKEAGSDESDTSSDDDNAARHFAGTASSAIPRANTRGGGRRDGWEVMTQKPKKTSQQRAEAREERSSNAKNRLKRQRKREKEVAAREALRKKL